MTRRNDPRKNDPEWVQTRRRHLYLCLLALTLPGSDQIALFPADAWIQRASELAEEYDTAMDRLRAVDYGDVAPSLVGLLEEVDQVLDKMSDDKSLWSNEALLQRPEWDLLRGVAEVAFDAGEWPAVPPSDLQYVFGLPADPSVFERVAGRLARK